MDKEIARTHLATKGKDRKTFIEMLFMRAYMPLAWCLMARTMEIRELRNHMLYRHVPHKELKDRPDVLHTEVRLTFRKNNQANPHKANLYEIHDNPDEPAAHVLRPLDNWLSFVKSCSFQQMADDPEALVFPEFDAAESPKFDTYWNDRSFQRIFKTVIIGSGILVQRWGTGTFSSHSLRRGCAQHRAMHPNPRKRWTLAAVRWWGGWNPSESNDVLMRYIIEAHDRQQNYYGDSMDPYRAITSLNHPVNAPNGPDPENTARLGDIHLLEQQTQLSILELRQSVEKQIGMLANLVQGLAISLTSGNVRFGLQAPLPRDAPPPTPPSPSSSPEVPDEPESAGPVASGAPPPDDVPPPIPPIQLPYRPQVPGKPPPIPKANNVREAIRQCEVADPPFHPFPLKDWPTLNREWPKYRAVAVKWKNRMSLYQAFKEYANSDWFEFARLFGTATNPALERIRQRRGARSRLRRQQIEGTLEDDNDEDSSPTAQLPITQLPIPTVSSAVPASTPSDDISDYEAPLSPRTVQAQIQAAEAAEHQASSQEPATERPPSTPMEPEDPIIAGLREIREMSPDTLYNTQQAAISRTTRSSHGSVLATHPTPHVPSLPTTVQPTRRSKRKRATK